MNKTAIVWIGLVLATGCGGASKSEPAYAPQPEYDGAWGGDSKMVRESAVAYAPAPEAAMPMADEEMAYEAETYEEPAGSFEGDERLQNQEQKPPEGFDSPMVVYLGFLKLRVKRLFDAVDEITAVTEKMGGYIDSLTKYVVVVRIPANDFDAVMAEFEKLGEVLDRRIKAMDVSEQYTDLGARLAVAKEARERLLKLLEKTVDVEERLRILQEIKRLSEQIESIESRLETLKNLIDYFTITIELVPVLEDTGYQTHRSPFPWVRSLSAHMCSIFDGKGDFEIELPGDFVLFEKSDEYVAQAADTTVIRGGVLENEPRANNEFWADAVKHEMDGRGEKLISKGEAGPTSYLLYRSDDVQPRYYMIAVLARGEDLFVVEVFFPTEEAKDAHFDEILEALETFEVL